MTTTTKHAPGTFCWPELGTTNQDVAKKFYGGIFGWTFKDTPMDANSAYTIFMYKDQAVAAAHTLMPDLVKQGVPPHWGNYIAVASADETVKKAKALGGTVVVEPMDVMGSLGRMAVLQDPTGATISIWEAKDHAGVGILREPNSLCWTELMTSDPDKAEAFYTQLIGWKTDKMPMENFTYTVFKRPSDNEGVGGMMKMPPDMKAPSNWTPYFDVADINGTVAKAKSLGANIIMPPTEIPNVGTFSIIADPAGAVFALLQPLPR